MEKRKVGRPKGSVNKLKAKSVKKPTDSVTLTGNSARRFTDARLALSESGRIPFEVTNSQFIELLLGEYEKSGSTPF